MKTRNSYFPRTRIKICGITRSEDALEAARLGADALGFVFYPASPRCISIEQASAIIRVLPPFVTTVGLFVDADAAAVEEVLRRVPLSLLQFHGEETPEYCSGFRRPYIKAVRMREEVDVPGLAHAYSEAAGLLLDAYEAGVPGGTGRTFDWDKIPKEAGKPVVLAGGLDAENVGAAVEKTRPYAVDVSSGVEVSKGIKDFAKMATFVRGVQIADVK